MSFTVFYLNPAVTPEVAAIIRAELPQGWRLLTPAGENDYADGLAASDFVLIADRALGAEHLARAPRLRLVQHQGVGYEKIDIAACRARGIPVALTPEGTSIGVAEHTLLLILASYKRLVHAANGVGTGKWMQWELRDTSFELCGKTLGLVGMGRIGREVARRALAFDAHVIYYDPLAPTPPAGLDVQPVESLDALLACADIVSLHVPLTDATRHLIGARTLRAMKPGALLVNTSRGGLVDEAALLDALLSGHLGGAALDVLDREPPDPAHPLLHRGDVLITPHISAGTRDALTAKMRAAFANMVRRTRGEPLHHVVPEMSDLGF